MTLDEVKGLSKKYAPNWGFTTSKDGLWVAFWGIGKGMKELSEDTARKLNKDLEFTYNRDDLEFIVVEKAPGYNRGDVLEWGITLVEKSNGTGSLLLD